MNALVLSHPVNACIPGSALHTSSPSDCPMAVMSRYLIRCFVSIQNSILALMLWLNVHARIVTSVSGTWSHCNHVHWMRHDWHEVQSGCQLPPVVYTIHPLCCSRFRSLQQSAYDTPSCEWRRVNQSPRTLQSILAFATLALENMQYSPCCFHHSGISSTGWDTSDCRDW